MLLSGHDDPIYPYEERVFRDGEVWLGGNSSNGPTMESVWTDDDADDGDLYDVSFWVDVTPGADAVRVSVDGSIRELPSSHGLAVCFIAGIPEAEVGRHRPTLLARRLGGRWLGQRRRQ